jgi:signal transduction histidine kinase
LDEVVHPNLQLVSDEAEKTAALVRLAGKISHELNNICTALIGNLALLEHSAEDEESASTIGEVRKSAERVIGLSAKLQAFAGRQLLYPEPVDINDAVIHAMEPLLPSLLKDTDLVMDLAKEDCIAAVDEEKFRAAISELVNNACASMGANGKLTVKTRVQDAQVEIRITDTGSGMPQQVLSRAMDPLFTTKPSYTKAGWGLSEVAGFVRQLGGEITLQSKLGQGTSVTLRLPAMLSNQAKKKTQRSNRAAAVVHSWP